MSAPTNLSCPHPTVWQISLASPPDNRLTPSLLASLSTNLDTVEAEWRRSGGATSLDAKKRGEHGGAGALVITSEIGKFFSNGLDYANSIKEPNFFSDTFDPFMWRLITFPIVTIAAINGHAFAAGMILAFCCDYRVITSGRGLVCMNELTFGAPFPSSFSALMSAKIPHSQYLRDTLMARRWTQTELLSSSLVDEIVDTAENEGALVARAIQLGIEKGPVVGPGSWGCLKAGVYQNVQGPFVRPVLEPQEEAERFWARVGGDKAKAKL